MGRKHIGKDFSFQKNMTKQPYINLGCGSNYNKEWTNMDFVSSSEYVKAYNLLEGIPFAENSFEVVYHSHLLEHFPKKQAVKFIEECYRILKPGGILRVVIPDLEQIALNYIKYLNEALLNVPGTDRKYEWTMLEMYDQTVRNKSGGEMMEYIRDISKNNDDFLLERNGKEVELIMKQVRGQVPMPVSSKIRRIMSLLYHFSIKNVLLKILLQKEYKTYEESVFRKQGEIHQWMYDRYSLKKILESVGFKKIENKSAFSSYLPDWNDYHLDGENGKVRKPDSLFMEAIK